MSEWPMGGFARMTADFMIARDLLGGDVLELGAGVGSCSALVAAHVSDRFVRTDLQPFLLKRQKIAGTVERYDFNEPGPWRELDTIFAVNALHCAQDKVATLRHLFAMLRPGGMLVLGEGRPYTDANGTPVGAQPFLRAVPRLVGHRRLRSARGLVRRPRASGLSDIGFAARRAGAHDLGGIIWARR